MCVPDHAPGHKDPEAGRQAFAWEFGYIKAMIQAVTTNTVRESGVNEPYVPDPYVGIVLRNTLLSQVTNQADRETLFKLFSLSSPELNREQGQTLKLEPIGEQGRRIHALLINRDPDSVGRLVSRVRDWPAEPKFLLTLRDCVRCIAANDRR